MNNVPDTRFDDTLRAESYAGSRESYANQPPSDHMPLNPTVSLLIPFAIRVAYTHGAIIFNTVYVGAALAGVPLRDFLRDRNGRLLWAAMVREGLKVGSSTCNFADLHAIKIGHMCVLLRFSRAAGHGGGGMEMSAQCSSTPRWF